MKHIYARTSTTDQNVEQQTQVLLAKYPDAEVHEEQASGKTMDRPVLQKLLETLNKEDSLIVYDISRLGRTAIGVCTLAEELKERGISLVIDNLGIDTSTPSGTMVLHTLAACAQMEREMMLEKQKIGIERAKSEGKYKGKQASPETLRNCEKALADVENGMNKSKAARANNISRATFYRFLDEQKAKETK
ncbi:TPA: recombinase family protein [Vibrio harveyi]|nr:recombinase family protein [Vibrio harveyi]